MFEDSNAAPIVFVTGALLLTLTIGILWATLSNKSSSRNGGL